LAVHHCTFVFVVEVRLLTSTISSTDSVAWPQTDLPMLNCTERDFANDLHINNKNTNNDKK